MARGISYSCIELGTQTCILFATHDTAKIRKCLSSIMSCLIETLGKCFHQNRLMCVECEIKCQIWFHLERPGQRANYSWKQSYIMLAFIAVKWWKLGRKVFRNGEQLPKVLKKWKNNFRGRMHTQQVERLAKYRGLIMAE